MSHTLLLHIQDDDPIVGEVDEFPGVMDQMIVVNNPRRKDGKDVAYLETNVVSVILPLHRITYIEIIPNELEDDIISFVKD